MATAWELCLKLGFIDGDTYTRGPSNFLLDEIEAFAKNWEMSDEKTDTPDYFDESHRMTNSYLYLEGAGVGHWGKALSNGYWNFLEWPKDSVQITDLLRELFLLVVKKQLSAKNNTRVASTQVAGDSDSDVPLIDRRRHLLFCMEPVRAEPPKSFPGNMLLNLKTTHRCLTPPLLSMKTVKNVGWPPQHPGTPPTTPAGNLKSTKKRARLDSQNLGISHSSSPEISSNIRRSTRLLKTPNSAMSAKRVTGKSPLKALPPKSKIVKREKHMPKRLLPAPHLRFTTPKVSVARQLTPAPEPQPNQSKPSSNKNIIFQFFLADENHGAIPRLLENSETMSSFFDEALAAWGALVEEQHQPRMAAVKVVIEGISRPIVVLWRDKDGFKTMLDTVLEQAAGKQTKLNVEVRCFQRG